MKEIKIELIVLVSFILHTKYLAKFSQMVAGDGDAAVDRGIELQVVVAGCARDDHTDPV